MCPCIPSPRPAARQVITSFYRYSSRVKSLLLGNEVAMAGLMGPRPYTQTVNDGRYRPKNMVYPLVGVLVFGIYQLSWSEMLQGLSV
jgi:hypothetical protein